MKQVGLGVIVLGVGLVVAVALGGCARRLATSVVAAPPPSGSASAPPSVAGVPGQPASPGRVHGHLILITPQWLLERL